MTEWQWASIHNAPETEAKRNIDVYFEMSNVCCEKGLLLLIYINYMAVFLIIC